MINKINTKKLKYVVSPINMSDDVNRCFFHSHVLAFQNGLDLSSENVAVFIDSNNEKIKELSLDNEERYNRYSEILAARLNRLNNKNYSDEFWYRTFSQGLLRYIAEVHQFYTYALFNFCPKRHKCNILSKVEYQVVNDFEEQRQLLMSSWLGQEQLFSLFIRYHYPENFEEFQIDAHIEEKIFLAKNHQHVNRVSLISILIRKIKDRTLFSAIYRKIIKRIQNSYTRPVVGICGSFFSQSYLDLLIEKSNGKINEIKIPELSNKIKKIDMDARIELSKVDENMDAFDKFFFYCIPYLLPMYLIENFDESISISQRYLEGYQNLKFIVSESWLGSSSINLFRALAYEKQNVETIYNEHNCFFHPFVGSPVNLQASVVDEYLTLGWGSSKQNFVRSGSLFPFTIPIREKKYKILHVSYPAEQVRAISSANYGQAGWSAICHLKFVKKFFELLPTDVLSSIYYRGYPKDYFLLGLRYDKESLLESHLKYVNLVASNKNSGETCKEQMASSSLVVIDYLSTAYLESLLMDIPTICFWDPDSMGLGSDHINFFDDLIDAKIIHTSPESAAHHLLQVNKDPLIWWHNAEVSRLKRNWIERNLGDPQLLVDHLLNLTK